MKAKKLIGSIALTAALAMGTTVPAFAADAQSTTNPWTPNGINTPYINTPGEVGVGDGALATVTGNNVNDKKGTGSTAVYASVYDADINVTVPVAMAIAFANSGVSDVKYPTNYTITNNSATTDPTKTDRPVQIIGVTGKSGVSSFKLLEGEPTEATTNQNGLFLNIGKSGANDWKMDGTGGTAGVAYIADGKKAVPVNNTTAVMTGSTPTYTFSFEGSKAAVGNPLSVGFLENTVAQIELTFQSTDANSRAIS